MYNQTSCFYIQWIILSEVNTEFSLIQFFDITLLHGKGQTHALSYIYIYKSSIKCKAGFFLWTSAADKNEKKKKKKYGHASAWINDITGQMLSTPPNRFWEGAVKGGEIWLQSNRLFAKKLLRNVNQNTLECRLSQCAYTQNKLQEWRETPKYTLCMSTA